MVVGEMGERRLPSKEEIERLAIALYMRDHPEAISLGLWPEREELSEGNYLVKARDMLMREPSEATRIVDEFERMKSEYLSYLSSEAEKFGHVVIPKETLEKLRPEELQKLHYELEMAKAQVKRLKRKLRDKEISMEEYRREKEREISELRKKVEELSKYVLRKEERPPPKVRRTKELERRLTDVFKAVLLRAGLSPSKFLPELRVELDSIMSLPTTEEMERAVERLATEIVERERGRRMVRVGWPRPTTWDILRMKMEELKATPAKRRELWTEFLRSLGMSEEEFETYPVYIQHRLIAAFHQWLRRRGIGVA